MRFLNFLKPAPLIPEIQDRGSVKEKYKYWRLRTFYSMYIGYAFYYFTRKSFTFAMPAMQIELGLGKFELGLLGSILSLSYGASKFLSGIQGDKSNPRYFMSIGLILTGVFNICFGFSSTWWTLAVFWGLNGWFQGWGWPGCAKLLTHWYSVSERGRWWSFWNTSHNLGGALIPLVIAGVLEFTGWRFAMWLPGVLSIGIGFFLINRLRDTPQSLGLPPIEKHRDDYPGSQRTVGEEKTLTAKELLFEHVLRNPYIWILAFSQFFIYVIRTALNDWSMLYLMETKGYNVLDAGVCIFAFEIGGFCGSLAAGWGSDVLFKGKRNPINILFTVGVLGVLLIFQAFPLPWLLIDRILMFGFGFFIFGPQMLIGVAAAELSHKKAAGTATGFAGCFAYLGAAMAGGPMGALIKAWGWNGYISTLFVCGVLGALILLPLWSVKSSPKETPVTT